MTAERSRPTSSSKLTARVAIALMLALTAPAVGCHTPEAVAPTYDVRPGAPIAEDELPLALAHYVFSPVDGADRKALARPLADRILLRARALLAEGRETTGLAAVRFAAMLVRQGHVSPQSLSDDAVAAIADAVSGPAARGEEGAAIGLYLFWSLARPSDARPKEHLGALSTWTSKPGGATSPLVTIGREAARRDDALAYAPDASDRPDADDVTLRWMDQILSFRDGAQSKDRYGDELYSAIAGYHTAAARLVANHLRDGDIAGAIEAISQPSAQPYLGPGSRSESLGRSLLEGGAAPSTDGYQMILGALQLEEKKGEGLEERMADAIIGTALVGTAAYPHDAFLAEVAARSTLFCGSGDAAPAILARGLLGTKDDPRRPAAKDLSRALSISAEAIREFADREDYAASRRTFDAATPLLLAADSVGGVTPSSATVQTLMALVEAESGRPQIASQLFEEALAKQPLAVALEGRAWLQARAGDVPSARASIESALGAAELATDPKLKADVLTFAAALARRAGDVAVARDHYEAALRVLVSIRPTVKGSAVTEVALRTASILSRFSDAAEKEDEASNAAEGATGAEPRLVTTAALHRFLRALRTVDGKRARDVFKRVVDLALPAEDQVRAAILARAIAKRAGVPSDPDIARVLTSAAARDDSAGRLAKFALGTLDGPTLISKASSVRRELSARFSVAIQAWADGGLEAAKPALLEVVRSDLLGALESELALELLEPDHGALTGTVTAKSVPGI